MPYSQVTITPVAGAPNGDPWDALPDYAPPSVKASKAAPGADPWDALPDYTPPQVKTPTREVGGGEATGRGIAQGVTFGAEPALAGVQAAANPDIEAAAKKFGIDPDTAKSFIDHVLPGLKTAYGAGRLAVDTVTGGKEPSPAQQAYSETRKEESEANTEASGQHPYLYGAGEIGGSLAAPVPGVAPFKAATTAAKVVPRLAAKIGNGLVQGAIAGGEFGAGNAIGEGKSVPEVMKSAGSGAVVGGAIGGPLGAVVGPRAAQVATTPGEKAAETAANLGAPLPRGLASDSPFMQATAQQARQIPLVGKRIDTRVGKTVEAAGNKVGEIVDTLTPSTERSATNVALQTPLNSAITNNKGAIDSAYDALRKEINPDQRFKMPKTEAALHAVKLARQRAGWKNPAEGLSQPETLVKEGGGFNGVQRARSDMYNAGKTASPHPGFDKGDFRRIRKAMDVDLKDIVRKASTNPNKAESLFNTAELTFGKLKDENDQLQKLLDAKGEGAVTTLLSSPKNKGGNLDLLAQIKGSVPAATFDRISGTILHELGHNSSTGKFSLNQFTTGWDKLSDGAKGVLFSPSHRQWINDIAELGRHIKGGDQYRNTSNTAGALILFDVLRAAGETLIAGSAGLISPGAFVGTAATMTAAELLTRYMAWPAKAKSMSAWAKAYRGLTLNQPTPARIAAFKIATRNLANNVDVPVDRIMSIVDSHIGSRASENPDNEQNNGLDQKPRPGISH